MRFSIPIYSFSLSMAPPCVLTYVQLKLQFELRVFIFYENQYAHCFMHTHIYKDVVTSIKHVHFGFSFLSLYIGSGRCVLYISMCRVLQDIFYKYKRQAMHIWGSSRLFLRTIVLERNKLLDCSNYWHMDCYNLQPICFIWQIVATYKSANMQSKTTKV